MRLALLGVAAFVAVAGCSRDDGAVPDAEDLAWEVPHDAELVCGIDAAAVEAALGLPVGVVEGEVTVEGGDAHDTCEISPGVESMFDGPMLGVRVVAATSEEGLRRGAEVTGDVPGVREPDVRYGRVEGGVWFDPLGTGGGQTTLGGSSVVVFGDYVVALTSMRNDPDRDAAEDLLALSQQVAATHDLAEAQG